MSDYFIYDGIDTRNYGMVVFNANLDESPEKEQESFKIPGRHGDLLSSVSRFANRDHQYMAVIYKNYGAYVRDFRDAILAKKGYLRLTDSFHPDEFYLARYLGPVEPAPMDGSGMGKFMIEFDRKPQRFLTSGETAVSVAAGGTIVNPTKQPSQPLLHVTGYGNLYINTGRITISNTFTDVYIDCEMMDCYALDGSTLVNANDYVSIREVDFPTLRSGSNSITYANTITALEITPRWWRA